MNEGLPAATHKSAPLVFRPYTAGAFVGACGPGAPSARPFAGVCPLGENLGGSARPRQPCGWQAGKRPHLSSLITLKHSRRANGGDNKSEAGNALGKCILGKYSRPIEEFWKLF